MSTVRRILLVIGGIILVWFLVGLIVVLTQSILNPYAEIKNAAELEAKYTLRNPATFEADSITVFQSSDDEDKLLVNVLFTGENDYGVTMSSSLFFTWSKSSKGFVDSNTSKTSEKPAAKSTSTKTTSKPASKPTRRSKKKTIPTRRSKKKTIPARRPTSKPAPKLTSEMIGCHLQIEKLKVAALNYLLTQKEFPSSIQDLKSLLENRTVPLDPWGNAYRFECDTENDQVTFTSLGPDGEFETLDDITGTQTNPYK